MASGAGAPSGHGALAAESYLRLHAYPKLGHRPIGQIRRSEIQAWVKERSEVLYSGFVDSCIDGSPPSSRRQSATA